MNTLRFFKAQGLKRSEPMGALQRQELHKKGLQLMYQGSYLEALEIMLKALNDFGPHVGLLSDLIATYYLAGRLEDCFEMTKRLEEELVLATPFLSPSSISKTKIFLGKIFEEQGHIDKSLDVYTEAIEHGKLEFSTRVRGQAQLLRLKSFLGMKSGLSDLYHLCLKARTESESLYIELEHGLMLAETVLMGPMTAFRRVQSLVAGGTLNSADLRLLVIDFAEEVLRQNLSVKGLREMLLSLPVESLDVFEKHIHHLYLEGTISVSELDPRVEKSLPLMNYLRLLNLLVFKTQEMQVAIELKRKFMFLLEGLSLPSRKLLLKKWNFEDQEETSILSYNPVLGVLSFSGQKIKLRKNAFSAKCLEFFKNRRDAKIEDFVRVVFASEYNDTYYDRVRIALQRLNKEMAPVIGRPRIFIASRGRVEIVEGLIIN